MKKRAIINFIASIAYQISNLLIGLIVPKLYTEIFGSVYNGLNQSVSQVMSLLNVLQFGISAAAIQQMFKYIANNDENMISAIYYDTAKQYRKMGYVFIAVIIPIIAVFPLMIKDELPYTIVVAFLLFRAISSAMEYFFQAKYSVILIANNKSYAIYVFNTLLLLFSTGLHLIVLFTAKNILLYQAVAVVSAIVRLVIVSTYVKRQFPYLSKEKSKQCEVPKENKRKDVLVSEIAGMVIDSTDLLLLSTFSGLVYTSIYSIYSFVTSGLGNVLSSCREAVFAGLGKTYFSDFDEFQKQFSNFESVYLFLMFYLYSTAILLFKPFIEIYTANMDANYVYVAMPIVFVCCRLIVNLRIPAIVTINTAGHFKQVKNYAVMEAVINFVISIILVKPFGIYGVLAGTLIGAAYRTPLLIHYSNKYIVKRKGTEYLKKVIMWMPLFVSSCTLSVFAPIKCTSLMNWVLTAVPVASAILVVSILWVLIFDRNLFNELLKIIKKFLHKGKKAE